MKTERIFQIFRRFHRSGRYAAKRLGVSAPTISMWINGRKPIPEDRIEGLSAIAAELESTKGACMSTVRSQLPRLRRAK